MMPPPGCPYSGLSAPPCRNCHNHVADTGECLLSGTARPPSATAANRAQTWDERLRGYEKKRQELLQLSKEQLVDLILRRPAYM